MDARNVSEFVLSLRTKVSAGKLPLMEALQSQINVVVDFDDYPQDRANLIRHCEDLIHTHATADRAWEQPGTFAPQRQLQAVAPDLWRATVHGKRLVDGGSGFLVLRSTHVERYGGEVAQLICLFVSTVFGSPTKTDKRLRRFAWPVRYEKTHLNSPTFSQTMAEAGFHTDSQYLEEPERYFGLFCVTSDVRGQGTNFLVSASQVVLRLLELHPTALDHLRSPFPFRVPSVFTTSASDNDIEVVWAPILGEGTIRFRSDTITSALELPGVTLAEAKLAAIAAFERSISETPTLEYHLEPGEAIVVDNHAMLHARSPFTDSNRLLYRVRMKGQDRSTNAGQQGLADSSGSARTIGGTT
ncbi:TauD/TfdA family dioxygenase [Arthrobacter sp. 4R501]|uniref:TauD/TfdA family dioxygenase n=1 Tax=Arthrobacter sp. 4R501 TaxID=2058886 RepID=UPI0011AFED8C|nr:TauD/TfdA family dioxygenase [Arthrobacter sp. 4R501]